MINNGNSCCEQRIIKCRKVDTHFQQVRQWPAKDVMLSNVHGDLLKCYGASSSCICKEYVLFVSLYIIIYYYSQNSQTYCAFSFFFLQYVTHVLVHLNGLKSNKSSSLPQKALLLKRLISSPAFNSMTS